MFSSCNGSKNENKVKIKRDLSVKGKPIERGEFVISRCHGSKISGSLQTVVLQIWQEKRKKLTCMTFLCMIALRNKTVAHTFLPSFDANGRLCQERLL